MDKTQLKHRIVGAIVLVALGVIFIPMILTTDDEFTISDTNIPAKPPELKRLADMTVPEPASVEPKPVLDAEMVDEKTPSKSVAQSQTNKQQPTPIAKEQTESSESATTMPKPEVEKSTQATAPKSTRAWVVQVASFTERDKALKLRDRLRKAKYPTFVESVSAKRTQHYRVRVGPVVRREHADEWQKKIAKEFKLPDALVMVHP